MRKSIAILCSVVVLLASVLVLPVSASSINNGIYLTDCDLYSAEIHDLLTNYNISSTDIQSSVVYYVSGYSNSNSNLHCSVLWIDGVYYRQTINYSDAIPSYSYYSASYAFDIYAKYCGHVYCAAFYYDGSSRSDQYQLVNFSTNQIGSYNNVYSYVGATDFSSSTCLSYIETDGSDGSASTVDDFVDASVSVYTPEPTEPATDPPVSSGSDSSAAEPFTLPEEWINGGETLAAVEAATFGDMDEQEALDILDSMSFDEVKNDTGLQAGFGVIWSLVSDTWESFAIGGITTVIMFIMILAWFFGRRL
ncbi:MAG: hypothetical protein ACI4C7_08200 [Clostridia bacterium]